EFIAKNKKDFILFQLEYAMKEAGDDTTQRAKVVSRIAESISRINKTEDFTKQQDYIRKTAEILKIDEGGLHNLINKITREKLEKEHGKLLSAEQQKQEPGREILELSGEENDALGLLSKKIYQER